MSKLEEMARLGAKVFAACTLRSHLDVHIVQVQQNADNSATFRVTDTQNSIGAVQEAVPAPGTQQYRLTSLLEPSTGCFISLVPPLKVLSIKSSWSISTGPTQKVKVP